MFDNPCSEEIPPDVQKFLIYRNTRQSSRSVFVLCFEVAFRLSDPRLPALQDLVWSGQKRAASTCGKSK